MKHNHPILRCLSGSFVILSVAFGLRASAQTIGSFTSVTPADQTQLLVIPPTHAFQMLVQLGDPLAAGGTMPIHPDFTGYVPIGGSSENGYLSVNSESIPGGVTMFDADYNTSTKLWSLTLGQPVDFSALGTFISAGTTVNCSGDVTPWGTVITCEENTLGTDLTFDGYIDYGWCIELDPVTRTVIDQDGDSSPDKLWALGRMRHENVVVADDSMTVYYGDEDNFTGYIYKFIADNKADLSSGRLWVLRQSGSTGQWVPLPNTSQDDRNNTLTIASDSGATGYNRVEDVDIGPDGKVYFASTTHGIVYRFADLGDSVNQFEVFVDSGYYDITHAGGVRSTKFSGCDNLAFDGEGNLWITQDADEKHVWVVRPSHTTATPNLEVFMNTPLSCEPTGITFSPDYRFMFMSFQHPNGGISLGMPDATNDTVYFDRDATVVIALKENLGLPVSVASPFTTGENITIHHAWPNPASSLWQISVSATRNTDARLVLRDAAGREVYSQSCSFMAGTQVLPCDVSGLATGYYTAELVWADGRAVMKLLR